MRKKNLLTIIVVIITLLLQSMFVAATSDTKKVSDGSKQSKHELPVLKTIPANEDDQVLVNTDIKISFNIDDRNYKQFRNQIEKEKYKLELNNKEVDSYFDTEQKAIILKNYELKPYNRYNVALSVKADSNNTSNNSGNATYAFAFNTVGRQGEIMKVITDTYGTEFKIVGAEEGVRDVRVYKDTTLSADEVLAGENRYSVIKAGAVRVDLPEGVSKVMLMSTFSEETETLLNVSTVEKTLEWVPFSIDEATGEISFNVFNDMTFIPIRYSDTQLLKEESLFPQSKMESNTVVDDIYEDNQPQAMSMRSLEPLYGISAVSQANVGRRFNILSNDDGYLKVELTYLKEKWNDYRYKLDLDGKPEVFVRIKKDGQEIANKDISSTTMTFDHTFNTSGVYTIEILEEDMNFDDKIWKQEVLIQMPFSLRDWDIEYLAKKYAPILLYHNDESYYPMSMEHLFQEISELDDNVSFKLMDVYDSKQSIKSSQVKEFMAYNGHSDVVFNMGNGVISDHLSGITGSEDRATVYYSYFESGNKFYINYHFIYAYDPKNGTPNSPDLGSHNFDRESMTLEFERGGNVADIAPENIIVGGHMDGQTLTLLGENNWWTSDTYESWDNVRVRLPYEEFKSPYSEQVVVNIAKGSHAIYPVSGWYKVLTLVEPAGLTGSILSNNRLNIVNNRVLFPQDARYNSESTYTLANFNLDNMQGNNPLNFSGYWVDVLGTSNAKFPPFTEREQDVSAWCNGADRFNLSNIPDVSKRTIEEFNKGYIFSKQTVKNFTASQDSSGIVLSWTPFQGIGKYKIVRKNTASGVVERNYETSSSRFVDTSVVPGQTYTYEIEGIYKLNSASDTTIDIPCKKDTVIIQYRNSLGKVKGTVKSAINNQPIANAVISVDNGTSVVVKTDSNGAFEADLTADQPHTLTVSKTGYTSVTYYNVRVEENETVYVETILQIPEEYADKKGTVTGRILNALSGQGISGARLRIRESMNNQSGSIIQEVLTDGSGKFTITNLLSGNYTAEVTSDNIITSYFNFICIGAQTTNRGDIPVTPKLSDNEIRIVLSWGANPRDLDSHLAGNGLHVYYANKNEPGISLDVDDVSGYGPETITIDLDQVRNGIYSYYVHHYAGTGTLGTSGANIKVYSGSQLVKEFNVPGSANGSIWSVFNINTETRQIESITTLTPQAFRMMIDTATNSSDINTVNDEQEMILNDIELNKKQ